jgi:hypothetical protein
MRNTSLIVRNWRACNESGLLHHFPGLVGK